MTPIRTFIAIEIPEDIRNRIAVLQSGLKGLGGKITWVKPENMHLTMKFLGETEQHQVKNIFDKLDQAVSSINQFEIKFKEVGAFPNFRRPKVFWVGTEGDNSTLIEVANKIDQQMCEFGFRPENKRFSAHLTIGRVRDQKGIETVIKLLQQEENFSPGEFVVKHVSFIKSELTRLGPIYTTLEQIKLN
jgi:RNA 2',3'-cyclic 3'-phosphodiesterase